jgi:hypothetical protein
MATTLVSRNLGPVARQMSSWFPVVSITGPRQSGKSTLVREVFPDYTYLNLEDPTLRNAALADPVGFVRNRPGPLAIDEAQYAPELFPVIQAVSDERGSAPGQYVLSGSQNFLLLSSIGQSLAGRVGVLRLLPLSFAEASAAGRAPGLDDFLARGGYPRLYDVDIPTDLFFDSYIATYIERDVEGYLDVRNRSAFRTFLSLCAVRVGSLVNVSDLARDAGVTHATATSWLSILESSYLVLRLPPYFENRGKRLVKTPKLYFYDTGLLCHLLGIHSTQELLESPMLGPVFENLVVVETAKRHLNAGKAPELYFYRDDSKREIDLLDYTAAAERKAVEVKSTQTFREALGRTLATVGEELGIPVERRELVYRGTEAVTLPAWHATPADKALGGPLQG